MELRTYSFNNFYLKGIHAGIQSAHSHDELTVKYLHPIITGLKKKCEKSKLLVDCQSRHKTIVVLNGGMQSNLLELLAFLQEHESELKFPFAEFYESKDALNGALTSISIVLPESIFKYSRIIPKLYYSALKSEENQFNDGINSITINRSEQETPQAIQFGEFLKEQYLYSTIEIQLMERISNLSLMS